MRTVGLVLTLLIGCASGGRELQISAERSFDGLHEVENARFGRVWVRPDFDLSGYDKVMLRGAGIEYRPVTRNPRSTGEFPIGEAGKERLARIMQEAFRAELARSKRFALTEAPGPDVLLLWGGLLDVVSFVPPTPADPRADVFVSIVGEATLVVELRDSQSDAILARIADRAAAQRASGAPVQTSLSATPEVRRMAQRWARLVRQRLDAAPTLRRVDDTP